MNNESFTNNTIELESLEINAPSEIFKSARPEPEEVKSPMEKRRQSPPVNSGRKSPLSSAEKSPLKSARISP